MRKMINICAIIGCVVCVLAFVGQYAYNNILTPMLVQENNNKIQDKIANFEVEAENNVEEVVEAEAVADVAEELEVESEPQTHYIGMDFEEGQDYGLITIGDELTVPMVCGQTVDSIKEAAAIHPYSSDTHKFIYGHNNKAIFKSLKDVAVVGANVEIQKMDGSIEKFVVREAHWVSEEEYNDQEYRNNLVLGDSEELIIATCCHIESGRGRWLVWCDPVTE